MDLTDILDIVKDVLYSLALFLALLYSCLILFVPRFHHQNNIFILNICINGISTGIYFFIYFYVNWKMPESMCILFHYTFNVASVQIPFAFVAFTIHRFCTIVHSTKAFFKTKRWVALCIASQWIAQLLISVPFVFARRRGCTSNTFWMGLYTVMTAIPLPLIVNLVFNVWIFLHVRKSSRRVQNQGITGMTSGNPQQQQARISRRDISLLKQMIFTFTMFVIGWTPSLVVNTITTTSDVSDEIELGTVFLSIICLVALMINLFICNHDVREYVANRIRRCFRCNLS